MRWLATGLGLMFMLMPSLSKAQVSTADVLWLYRQCKSPSPAQQNSCAAYVLGMADIMSSIGGVYANSKTEEERTFFKQLAIAGMCGPPVSAGMLRQAFIDWVEAHPNERKTSMAVGVMSALQETWPCNH